MQESWFLIYYAVNAIAMSWYGAALVRRPERIVNYLIAVAEHDESPRLVLRTLRYMLMFAVVSLAIAFLPPSLFEIMYTAVMIIFIFSVGRLLLMWNDVKGHIREKQSSLLRMARKGGVMMALFAVLSVLLWLRLLGAEFVLIP